MENSNLVGDIVSVYIIITNSNQTINLCGLEAEGRGDPDRAPLELIEAIKKIPYPTLVLKESSYFLNLHSRLNSYQKFDTTYKKW